jgi:hypothetical protein
VGEFLQKEKDVRQVDQLSRGTIMKHGLAWLCVVGSLLGVGMTQARAPKHVTAGPVLDKATLAEVRKLQEKRRDLLREALLVREKLFQSARAPLREVVETSKQLLTAELELAATGAERVAAHERHFEKALAFSKVARARHESGRGTFADVLDAEALFLEAKIGWLKAGGKLKKAKK